MHFHHTLFSQFKTRLYATENMAAGSMFLMLGYICVLALLTTLLFLQPAMHQPNCAASAAGSKCRGRPAYGLTSNCRCLDTVSASVSSQRLKPCSPRASDGCSLTALLLLWAASTLSATAKNVLSQWMAAGSMTNGVCPSHVVVDST